MRVGFTCPDGQNIKFADCLKSCRMGDRCASEPTLHYLAQVRPWEGKTSPTMCFKGNLQNMLETLNDWYCTVDSMAFLLFGQNHHSLMDAAAKGGNWFSEERIDDEEQRATPDIFNETTLIDYKTYGSYKVMKVLGIRSIDTPTGEVLKSGPRTGKPKTRKVKEQRDEWRDMHELIMQLNRYRVMVNKKLGYVITKLKCQITVRDGGIMVASTRGITKNIYFLDVPIITNDKVNTFFKAKDKEILEVINAGTCSTECTEEERWDGIRCKRYCHVNHLCWFYQAGLEKEVEK